MGSEISIKGPLLIFFIHMKSFFIKGDSGGPLFTTGPMFTQIGIMSGGQRKCGFIIDFPDFYTNVGSVRALIDSALSLP